MRTRSIAQLTASRILHRRYQDVSAARWRLSGTRVAAYVPVTQRRVRPVLRRTTAVPRLGHGESVISAELVEANPILDERNVTAKLGVELRCSLLGKKIL